MHILLRRHGCRWALPQACDELCVLFKLWVLSVMSVARCTRRDWLTSGALDPDDIFFPDVAGAIADDEASDLPPRLLSLADVVLALAVGDLGVPVPNVRGTAAQRDRLVAKGWGMCDYVCV